MSLSERTSAEVKARYEQVSGSFLDFQGGDLLPYMDFEDAKPHLNEDVTAEQLAEHRGSLTPLEKAKDYLPFAWEKANNCRGISASRSVDHMKAWLWLAGYDVNADFDSRYEYYGKPCLVTASELVGFDWRAADNGEWVNGESEDGISDRLRTALIDDAIAAAQTHRNSREKATA